MEQIGKILVVSGLGIALLGALLWFSQRIPWLRVGRLPGDIVYQRDGVTIFIPIVTMLVLSLLASAVLWLVAMLRR